MVTPCLQLRPTRQPDLAIIFLSPAWLNPSPDGRGARRRSMLAANPTDEDLVAASRNGDGEAFARIVERYQAMVCAVTFSILGELALSEDAAQDAFVIAWQQLTTLREPNRLRAWLAGIARNVARVATRKRGHDVVHRAAPLDSATPLAATEPFPDEQTARREEEGILWKVLSQVAEPYREALVLYYREHQSVL